MNARLPSTQPAPFDLHAEQTLGRIAVELPGVQAQPQDGQANHIHLENNLLFAPFDAPAPRHSPCCGSCGG